MNIRVLPYLTAVLTAIAGTAWAQSDPKITAFVTPVLDPDVVTLSRGDVGTSAEFIGQAAYRVKITMNASNVLNRALFKANTSVVEAHPSEALVPGATAKFDERASNATIVVGPVPGSNQNQDPSCEVDRSDSTKTTLSCDFGDSQLVTGDTAEFIILVQSPRAGGRIKLDWSFGGDEGKGGGNGCCTKVGREYTDLIDAVSNETVKKHVQTFVVKNATTTLFTGVSKGATKEDPWTTIAELGSKFTVGGNSTTTYVQGVIDEKVNEEAGIFSCSPLNKNQCWQSQLTVANTTWPLVDHPLWITLERHSSIIKNGAKLTDYALGFLYSTTGAEGTFNPIRLCADLSGGLPTAGNPCLAPKPPNSTVCVERSLPTSPRSFVWSCTIKAVDNGVMRR